MDNLGGIGHSWFVVEVVSEPVDVDPTPPTPVPPVVSAGSDYGQSLPAAQRHIVELPAEYLLVKRNTSIVIGHYGVKLKNIVPGEFYLIKNSTELINGEYTLSNRIKRIILEDEEILLII